MGAFDDVLAGNAEHRQQHRDTGLPGRAARGLAVVTCMDSRIDPLRVLGLAPGDAKVLRTAGARVTDDVLRGLVVGANLLGVERVLVLAHTDCGMANNDDETLHRAITERSGVDSRGLDLLAVGDQGETLAADVGRVRASPYLPDGLQVAGALYDVRSGAVDVLVEP